MKRHRNSDTKKQATANRNKTTALERSVMNYWGLKLILNAQFQCIFISQIGYHISYVLYCKE